MNRTQTQRVDAEKAFILASDLVGDSSTAHGLGVKTRFAALTPNYVERVFDGIAQACCDTSVEPSESLPPCPRDLPHSGLFRRWTAGWNNHNWRPASLFARTDLTEEKDRRMSVNLIETARVNRLAVLSTRRGPIAPEGRPERAPEAEATRCGPANVIYLSAPRGVFKETSIAA